MKRYLLIKVEELYNIIRSRTLRWYIVYQISFIKTVYCVGVRAACKHNQTTKYYFACHQGKFALFNEEISSVTFFSHGSLHFKLESTESTDRNIECTRDWFKILCGCWIPSLDVPSCLTKHSLRDGSNQNPIQRQLFFWSPCRKH